MTTGKSSTEGFYIVALLKITLCRTVKTKYFNARLVYPNYILLILISDA